MLSYQNFIFYYVTMFTNYLRDRQNTHMIGVWCIQFTIIDLKIYVFIWLSNENFFM